MAGVVLTIDSDDDPLDSSDGEEDEQSTVRGASERFAATIFDAKDVDSDEEVDDGTVQESWDFTEAIKKIKAKEHPAQRLTTSLDEKIKTTLEARALRQAKEELRAEQLAKGENSSSDEQEQDSSSRENESDSGNESISADEEQESGDSSGDEQQDGSQGDSDDSDDDDAENESSENGSVEKDEDVKDVSRDLGGPNSQILKNKAKLQAQQKMQKSGDVTTFAQLNLSRPLIRAIQVLGFDRPTPIQAKAIPYALAGRDICGSAVTGSGKTAAFSLPLLDRLLYRPKRVKATRVLIVTPTRELTQQCHSMISKLSQFTDITCCAIVGGLSLSAQIQELRARPDIVVATPGRMIDHVRNSQSVDLDDVEILVLDEADRLLELGFLDEVKELVKFCPKSRQTMLFSATMTTSVNQLAELSLNRPVRIQADPLYDMASRLIQEFVRVKEPREKDRDAMVLSLCTRSFKEQVIVFFERKQHAHRFGIIFGLCGLNAAELHGNLTQAQRLEALQRFRDRKVDYLLCTDLAARGLDISGVQTVINYEMPRDLNTYVHRVGRTARAGRGGVAVTLASERQRKQAKEVLKRSKKNVKSRTIPESVIDSFKDKIIDLEPDIEDVLSQERVEREMRLAEMEATKAGNIVKYQSDIKARPQRTWFQSEREKQAVREAQRDHVLGTMDDAEGATSKERRKMRRADEKQAAKQDKDKRVHRLTRKKRRNIAMKAELERDRAENPEAFAPPPDLQVKVTAKMAKRKARMGEEKDPDASNSKKKKKKKKRAGEEEDKGPSKKRARLGHEGDLSGFARELRPGEALSLMDARSRNKKGEQQDLVFKEMDLSKTGGLRKGGKLGRNKFKSKSRYKRRK